MPKFAADYARQSDPLSNHHFSRRWIEPAWIPAAGTSRLNGHRVRPFDGMIHHSGDASRHVLAGRAMENFQ